MFKRKGKFLVTLVVLAILLVSVNLVTFAADELIVGVGGWAVEPTKRALEELNFTEKTGIEVTVTTRPGSPPEFISQMTSSILGGQTPYDVIDLEDDAAINFSRSGWLVDLDPIYDEEFWADWTPGMLEMVDTWNRYEGELFRIPHNYETQYFFYRKDILEEKGLEVPQSWEEMIEVGKELTTDEMYAFSDGLAKGGYLGVYVSYLTQQAGGNPFDFGPELREALKFIHDMIYEYEIFPSSALNKDFDQVNNDFVNDRVAMMRMWPYFFDYQEAQEDWYSDDKVGVALPPKGPESRSTFVASWGWAIPNTSDKIDAAKTFIEFMTSVENAPKLAEMNTWFLSPRHSIMEEINVEESRLASNLKKYSDAGVIASRPFHPNFRQASSIVEELSSAYLTNQISLDEVIERGQQQMQALEE
ncbi:ABC transporter substrate-binding protein [Halanaerobium sp. ST460_2HS_T2]|jgi:ABC-type glycerol-3-phosphate transport system substrate-binding protein|uniref:ABC transporter substrate-binding protein n=1 Tax=Halanaerobium TaxID=2330 RepID=UPI000DF32A57|nr:sugar ABC transporter substrate-binding protein [Halanaerobium sp. ST460_2HS_T2]RCW62418.1 carbohydrate ABC transporter substrate-binding protein (CUT1 family) [Halanaerobium sp. ST460_2HS_T2]